jgi:hypothetical protein
VGPAYSTFQEVPLFFCGLVFPVIQVVFVMAVVEVVLLPPVAVYGVEDWEIQEQASYSRKRRFADENRRDWSMERQPHLGCQGESWVQVRKGFQPEQGGEFWQVVLRMEWLVDD